MKRLLVVAVLLVAAVFALSGCEAARYEQEELDQITQAGMEMMRSWLDENMPEAQIENCEALRLRSFDHTIYLSDYADGNILYKGERIPFAIHTVTGQVCFDHRQQEWDRAVRTYLCEITGISPETEDVAFKCAYMAPLCIHDPEKKANLGYDYLDLGIPAEVQNIEAFVRDPESRREIDVSWIDPWPMEDAVISAYSLAFFRNLRQTHGLRIDNIHIDNGSCYFFIENGTKAAFGQFGSWYEEEGLWFRGPVRVRWESLDRQTNGIQEHLWEFDPEADLTVERTETGWIFTCSGNAWGYDFQVYTQDGSEFLQHDYLLLNADWDPERGQSGVPMSWAKQKDGTYKLVHGESGQGKTLNEGRLERLDSGHLNDEGQ